MESRCLGFVRGELPPLPFIISEGDSDQTAFPAELPNGSSHDSYSVFSHVIPSFVLEITHSVAVNLPNSRFPERVEVPIATYISSRRWLPSNEKSCRTRALWVRTFPPGPCPGKTRSEGYFDLTGTARSAAKGNPESSEST